jgi:hypothetical protein
VRIGAVVIGADPAEEMVAHWHRLLAVEGVVR